MNKLCCSARLALFPALFAALPISCVAATLAATDAPLELSAAQRQSTGIQIAHPVASHTARHLQAYGRVLNTATFIADSGKLTFARAADKAADNELARLRGLYKNGAGTSLKSVQAAHAARVQTQVAEHTQAAAFAAHWGPLATLSSRARSSLITALSRHQTLLLRATLPSRSSIVTLPSRARADIDGIHRPAKVLGVLPAAVAAPRGVSLLLQLDQPPQGLGADMPLSITLLAAPVVGVVIPASALLYSTQGAYVYRQLSTAGQSGHAQFSATPVKLLQPTGNGWVVSGIGADDAIVVHGAGALWSLQGVDSISDDDDD